MDLIDPLSEENTEDKEQFVHRQLCVCLREDMVAIPAMCSAMSRDEQGQCLMQVSRHEPPCMNDVRFVRIRITRQEDSEGKLVWFNTRIPAVILLYVSGSGESEYQSLDILTLLQSISSIDATD